MPTPVRPRPDPDRPGSGTVVAGVGAALLMMICCAAPVLLAAGALGALGAWLSNPWVIGAAVALAATVVLPVLARRSRGGKVNPDDRDACCPPASPTPVSGPADRDRRPTPKEGPHHR